MSRRRSFRIGLIALALAGAAAFGVVEDDYAVFVVNLAMLAAVSAVALNLLTGFAGQVSIGSAAFLALGALTTVLMDSHVGFLASVLAGGMVAALVGFLVGLPSLRLRGLYLSLTTLALQFIVQFGFNQYQIFRQAPVGFRLPVAAIGPVELRSDKEWYTLILIVVAIVLLVSTFLLSGKPGRAWIALREHDVAAAIVGVDVTRYKLLAFTVSSFYIGIAGALGAYYTRTVSSDPYTLELAISFVAMIIIGGLGSLWGSVVGAFIVSLLPLVVSNVGQTMIAESPLADFVIRNLPFLESMAYGLVVLAFLYFEPRGIAGLLRRLALRRHAKAVVQPVTND